MSTILKALQRLEDEKSAKSARSLDEQVVARRPSPEPERRGAKLAVIAIALLAVAGGAFFFVWQRESPEPEVAAQSAPAAPQAEVAVEEPVAAEVQDEVVAGDQRRRKAPPRAAPPARAREQASAVEVSPVVEVVKRLDAPPSDDAARAALDSIAETLDARPEPSRAGSERPARRASARRSEPTPAREPVRAQPAPEPSAESATAPIARSAPATAAAQPAPVEVASDLEAVASSVAPAREPTALREFVERAKLPMISIERTIWHPDAERRVAVVKLIDVEETLRLREGDAIGPLVVIRINPGSVLFDHDDVEISYNVGS